MPRFVFMVLTNAKPGQDDEFNNWYTNTHLGEVLSLDGFVSAQRYKLVEGAYGPAPAHEYMALYEIEADDLDVARASLSARARSGGRVVSSAIAAGTAVWYFEPITERITA